MGTFVQNSLVSGERIESEATISWFSQIGNLFAAIVLLIVLRDYLAIAIPIASLFILSTIINVLTTELAVTNKKVIGKTGFIRRLSVDIPLHKLESLTVNQGIFGRILKYGSIMVRGTGGTAIPIPYINSPYDFRRVAMELADKTGNNPS